MSTARAWLAQSDEAEAVAALLGALRGHLGPDGPGEKPFLRSPGGRVEGGRAEAGCPAVLGGAGGRGGGSGSRGDRGGGLRS